MTYTQVFNLSTVGMYPYEKYAATPITFAVGNFPQDFTSIFWNQLDGGGVAIPTGGSLITREYLKYHKNPLSQVMKFSDPFYNSVIKHTNAIYQIQSSKFDVSLTGNITNNTRYIESVPTITISNANNNFTSLDFDIWSLRQSFKTPYEFYFFYIQLNDITKNSYGYIIYPNKIFLKPLQITNNNNKWQLKTSVNILSSYFLHIQSTDIERDALTLHRTRLNSLPSNITNLPNNLLTNNINFSLYSSRTASYTTAVAVTSDGLAPLSASFYLDDSFDLKGINPDSTFVSYNINFTNDVNQIINLTQVQKNVSEFYNIHKFNPTFILSYNPTVINEQVFQLLQAPFNPNVYLSDFSNCALNSTINLTNGLFNFSNYYEAAKVSFYEKSPLCIDYISDYYTLKNANVAAANTLASGNLIIDDGVTQTPQAISSPFLCSSVNNKYIIWETDYPPYCYSYKTEMVDGFNSYLDSNSLNFYLKLSIIEQTANTVKLSAYIASDFNAVTMPIVASDSIKFEIISVSHDDKFSFLSSLRTYYGDSNNSTPYDIIYSPSILASSDQFLTISYSDFGFAGASFTVKATITTPSGDLQTFDALTIQTVLPSIGTGNGIFMDITSQTSNRIVLNGSYNTTTVDWPSRDLSASKILWTHSGKNLPLTFNYVDEFDQYIGPVNGDVVFGPNTWRVSLSGYGPDLISISLSSQKYSEVVTLSTNPNLYDVLSEGKLKVAPITKLDNLNTTRIIKLSAAIPHGDRLFYIPASIPINWTWEYDDIADPTIQPITLKAINNGSNEYPYGINIKSQKLSSMIVEVIPGYALNSPKLHKVKIIANIDCVQPPITGCFEFYVDDFPDPSIFNSDFNSYYTAYQDEKYLISDTRINQNTITRPENSVLNFTFSAKNDTLKNIQEPNLRWSINSTQTLSDSDVFGIQLTQPLSGFPMTSLNGFDVTAIKIGLSINSAFAPGWTSAHSVTATTNIFILNSVDFYNPLSFIIYPEYAWLGKYNVTTEIWDNSKVTLLSTTPDSPEYFTNCFMPSAYGNRYSNSQTYWVSANKSCFSEFIYKNKQNNTIVTSPSAYDLIEIPYDPNDFTIFTGIPITLVGYNQNFYPENIQSEFIYETTESLDDIENNHGIVLENNVDSFLVSSYYRISAQTNNKKASRSEIYDNFFMSPIIKPYNDVKLEYDVLVDGIAQKTFNIQSASMVGVVQKISTIPDNSPAKIIGGTVTYYLSSQYWTVSSTVPFSPNGLSAVYDLFEIKYGDPSVPYYSCSFGPENFSFYSTFDLEQQILETTFDKYIGTEQYPSIRDLWSKVKL